MTNPKFCSQCGTPISEGTKFCSSCGSSIARTETSSTVKNSSLPIEKPIATRAKPPMKNDAPPIAPQKNGLKDKYFSFKGRLNRKAAIMRWLLLSLLYLLISGVLLAIIESSDPDTWMILFVLFLMLCLPLMIAGLSITCRRFHDLGKPGTYILFNLIPLINIYFFYLLLFKKGTDGSNVYGADPLQM